jgi:Zn-dependent protease with chaperone function
VQKRFSRTFSPCQSLGAAAKTDQDRRCSLTQAGESRGRWPAGEGEQRFDLNGYGLGNRSQPAKLIRQGSIDNSKELGLDFFRNRPALARTNGDAVDAADRRDFSGSAGKEDFVRHIEQFARNALLNHGVSEALGDPGDTVTGDAGQDAGGDRRGVDDTVANHEDILTRAFADVAVDVEGDAFGVAVDLGFHVDQLRVIVVASALGQGRQSVWSHAVPTGNADVNAFRNRFRAQVLAPFPAGNVAFDRVCGTVNAKYAVSSQHDGAEVAALHLVYLNQLDHRIGDLLVGKRTHVYAVDLGRIKHAANVFIQTKHGWALLRLITTNTLEDGAPVADYMAKDMDGCILPVDQTSVVPYFFGGLHGNIITVKPMSKRILLYTLMLSALLFGQAAKLKEIKPGMNFFKKEQDVQMGKEYAQQIEQQYDVIQSGPLVDYINSLGQKIAAQPQAGGFPYVFKVVNDPGINAFALPGGPVYINSGIILNAQNEGQVMGVIAHECSHIALRHSTNQVSRSYMIQLPAMIAGVYGQSKGGLTGMLSQMGVGLAANGLLMKFSRGAEQQADLLGARMMAEAGYNPIEMARFFETLEAKTGGKAGGLDFFSSHPNPGNRVKYVSEEVTLLPQREFNTDTGKFQKMQQLAKNLPAPKKKAPAAGEIPNQPPQNSDGSRTWTGAEFSIKYPGTWLGLGEPKGPTVTIAPKEGIKQGANGTVQIGLGVIVAKYEDDDGRFDFKADTQKLIAQVIQQNPSMGKTQPQINQNQVNGRNVYVARLVSKSPLDGGNEIDTVVTIAHRGGMIYMVFIAPERQMQSVQGDFDNMLNSLSLQ